MCMNDTIKPFPPGHYWSSETRMFKKWWHLENNLEDCDLSTFDEEAAMKKTAELLY